MRRRIGSSFRPGVFGLAVLLCLGTVEAGAQKVSVRGVVHDADGRAIPDADVAVVSARQVTRTDGQGRFALSKIPAGRVHITARRLGYSPGKAEFVAEQDVDSIRLTLTIQPALIAAMEVSSSERQKRQWIEDFYRRRAQGLGQYVTREEILSRNSFRPSDMFRNTPGVQIARGRGLRFNYAKSLDPRRDCPPLIWVDGQRALGMELDDLSLPDIEGIELYSGPSTTPMQFSSNITSAQTCGTIVVWTRPPNSKTP
ncbi:MAG TPA: carboxypeptidase regulatory-like domain-containing protein [Gemmatimonadaceae bacterium]|nr:carboxypeptidase regulatory-like domain-containing protein [Gemmatimonadaceae bacterium]